MDTRNGFDPAPYDTWMNTYTTAMQLFMYCGGQISPDSVIYKEFQLEFGDPSEELKEKVKESLREALEGWMASM